MKDPLLVTTNYTPPENRKASPRDLWSKTEDLQAWLLPQWQRNLETTEAMICHWLFLAFRCFCQEQAGIQHLRHLKHIPQMCFPEWEQHPSGDGKQCPTMGEEKHPSRGRNSIHSGDGNGVHPELCALRWAWARQPVLQYSRRGQNRDML